MNSTVSRKYRLVARSDNTNSFGLRGHVFMSDKGLAFEAARSDGDHHARQFEVGKDYFFPLEKSAVGGLNVVTAPDSFELFRQLPFAPDRVVKSVFRDATLA